MKQKRTIQRLRAAGRILPAALGLVFGLLASCTQEETPGGVREAVLTVSRVTIAGEAAPTRAVAQPEAVTSGKLGVGMRAQNGYAAQELVYTYTDGAWNTSTKVSLSNNFVSLYAWHPQEGYTVSNGTIALATQAYSDEKDLTYAASSGSNVSAVNPYAAFELQHVYARVKTEIGFPGKVGASRLGEVYILATGNDFYADGTWDVTADTLTLGSTVTDRMTWSDLATDNAGLTYRGDMLAIPAATVNGAKFCVTLDGKRYSVELGSALAGLEGGKSYRIRATLGIDLTLQSVEVEEWADGSPQTGEMQFE